MTSENTASIGYDLDELYAAYCEFMTDAACAMLPGEPTENAREHLLHILQHITKEQFRFCMENLKRDPEQLRRFQDMAMRGWQNGRDVR